MYIYFPYSLKVPCLMPACHFFSILSTIFRTNVACIFIEVNWEQEGNRNKCAGERMCANMFGLLCYKL